VERAGLVASDVRRVDVASGPSLGAGERRALPAPPLRIRLPARHWVEGPGPRLRRDRLDRLIADRETSRRMETGRIGLRLGSWFRLDPTGSVQAVETS